MAENNNIYTQGIGRRKSAVAQVRLYHDGKGDIEINSRPFEVYFPLKTLQISAKSPLVITGSDSMFNIVVKVKGGGTTGQADSVKLGIARALIDFNPEFRTVLKKQGMLTRDARIRERKKYGKKSARRSPQWSKR